MVLNMMKIKLLIISLVILLSHPADAAPIGICYGRVANNLPQPSDVINLIKSNGISRIRLFNIFDGTVDAFVYAMEREGFGGIPTVVTETGWPTSGGLAESSENALAYNGNVVRRVVNNIGTPKRPGVGIEVYLFDLFDENEKGGEEFEKPFGIFGVNGVEAYDLNFN